MKRKHFVLAVLVTALFVFAIGATWVVAQNDGVIQACVGPQGQLRVVQSKDECRPSEEDYLVWNIVGLKGDKGDPGPQGPPGPPAAVELFLTSIGSVSLPLGVEKDVISIDLPVGNYDGEITLWGSRQGVEGRSVVGCQFETVDSSGRNDVDAHPCGGNFGNELAQPDHICSDTWGFEEPTKLIFVCTHLHQEPAEPAADVIIDVSWTLLRVDTMHNQTPVD